LVLEKDVPADAGTPFEVDHRFDGAHDTPFEMDPVLQNPMASASAVQDATTNESPFVLDTKAGTSQATAKMGTAKAELQSKGTSAFTIVRNGDLHPGEQPATTRMVMRLVEDMALSTAGPSTSAALQFELGQSMLEVKSGSKGTPDHVAHQRRMARIAEDAKVSAVREVGDVTPHAETRLMRKDEEELPVGGHPDGQQKVPKTDAEGGKEATAKDAAGNTTGGNATDADDKVPVAVAGALKPGITVPATPGHKGSDPSVPLAATPDSNDTQADEPVLSAPASIFNATSEEMPLNISNITARLPKVVTATGAVISISLGGLVTALFFLFLLFIINAGKLQEKEAIQEPPRTRTYRQLLAKSTSTQSPPSV